MVLCHQWQTSFCSCTHRFCSFFGLLRCFLHFGFSCTWIRGCPFYFKDQPSNVVHQGRYINSQGVAYQVRASEAPGKSIIRG